jgi:hypothetical protein
MRRRESRRLPFRRRHGIPNDLNLEWHTIRRWQTGAQRRSAHRRDTGTRSPIKRRRASGCHKTRHRRNDDTRWLNQAQTSIGMPYNMTAATRRQASRRRKNIPTMAKMSFGMLYDTTQETWRPVSRCLLSRRLLSRRPLKILKHEGNN